MSYRCEWEDSSYLDNAGVEGAVGTRPVGPKPATRAPFINKDEI